MNINIFEHTILKRFRTTTILFLVISGLYLITSCNIEKPAEGQYVCRFYSDSLKNNIAYSCTVEINEVTGNCINLNDNGSLSSLSKSGKSVSGLFKPGATNNLSGPHYIWDDFHIEGEWKHENGTYCIKGYWGAFYYRNQVNNEEDYPEYYFSGPFEIIKID